MADTHTQSFLPREMVSVIVITVVAGCVPALQPLLLGGLLAEGRITAAQIGQAATAEGLGMAAASAFAGLFLSSERLRTKALVGIIGGVVANVATLYAPAAGIIAARTLSGACNGILLWLIVGMFTRAALPARMFSIYVTAQASGTFVLSTLLGTIVLPRFGVQGGYVLLAALNAALLVPMLIMPPRYRPLADGPTGSAPPARGYPGLFAVGFHLAGIMVLWVYLMPLGIQSGQTQDALRSMVSVATGIQILGGIMAFLVSSRLSGHNAVVISAGASIVALLAMQASGAPVIWFAATGMFAFFWMFAPPFHIPFLIGLDPTRRSAMFVGTAQLLGLAGGPLLGSILVTATDFRAAIQASIACFAAVIAIAFLARLVNARRPGNIAVEA